MSVGRRRRCKCFFQAEGGIRDLTVTGVQTCALPICYRRIENIPDEWGTAVNVQTMVFGHMGDDSATGVAFTRAPGNGEDKFYGEYLVSAQGEDVVAGIRTPGPINKESKSAHNKELKTLEELMPRAYKELYS